MGGRGWYFGIKALTPATVKRRNSKNALKITYSWVNTCFASKDTFTKIVGNFHCSSVTISIISLFLLFLAWGSIIVRPQCSDHWKTAWKENDCTEKSNVWPGAVLHHNQYPNVTLVTVFSSSFFSNMSHNSHSFEEKEVKKKPLGTRFRAVLYLSLVAPAALGTFALGQLENITFFIRVVCLAPQFYRFRTLGHFIFS